MKRREFLAGSGLVLASLCSPAIEMPAEESALKRFVADYYDIYYKQRDKQRYRRMLTPDYLLLENGEIMDAEKDIAAMPSAETFYERTDSFDFRHVHVEEKSAYLVYFLKSTIKEKKGLRHRQWLESIILQRSTDGWQVALLHSTRMAVPEA